MIQSGAMPREENYVERICRLLDRRGAWWVKTTGQSSKKGCPDLLACYMGSFIAIEVKSPVGRPSPIQRVQLERIAQAQGYAILAVGDLGVKEVEKVLDFIVETSVSLVA